MNSQDSYPRKIGGAGGGAGAGKPSPNCQRVNPSRKEQLFTHQSKPSSQQQRPRGNQIEDNSGVEEVETTVQSEVDDANLSGGFCLGTGGLEIEKNQSSNNMISQEPVQELYQLLESTLRDPPEKFKKSVVFLIDEYFNTGDVAGVSSDLRELGSNEYHPYFIKRLISIAMGRPDNIKEMASVLLLALYADVVNPWSISQGFLMLLEGADDLVKDISDAVDILALFIARAVVDDILPVAFVTGASKGTPLLTKGLLVMKAVQKNYLSARNPAELVKRTWAGHTYITVDEKRKKISDLLREFVESGDTSEACRCIGQLGVVYFRHEIVKRALILAMETSTAKPAILKFLKEGAVKGLISSSQMVEGFTRLAKSLDDLASKLLSAKMFFQSLVPKAVTGGLLEASAKFFYPGFDGGGGKETWGKMLVPGCESPIDRNDPNYAAVEEVNIKITDLLREYVESGDTSEACRCIQQSGVVYFHHEIVKRALILAMETRSAESAIVKLLKEAAVKGLISSSQMVEGFTRLAKSLEDLASDIPSAKMFFQSVVPKAVTGSLLEASVQTCYSGFDGGGGKGTWGNILVSGCESLRDRNDQTYATVEEVNEKISDLLREYVESGDTSEACRCIRQLGVAFFHHEVVKRVLVLSMETHMEKPAILNLLKVAADEGLITSSQMLKGFTWLAESLDDLAFDTSCAETLFQSLVSQAVTDGWLDVSFLKFSENNGEVQEKNSEKLKLYKKAAVAAIQEYFHSGDIPKLIRKLEDLRAPEFKPIFLKELITLAMENREREMASVLLPLLFRKIFSTKDIVDGFVMLLEDTTLDVLDASNLSLFLAKAVNADVLVPLNLEEIGSRLPPNCSGSETLHKAELLLAAHRSCGKKLSSWGGGTGWAMEDAVEIRDLVREREEKLEVELSPTSYLREYRGIFSDDKNRSLHNTFLEVYINFIKARKSPDSDKMKAEDIGALSCYAHGNSKLGSKNQRLYEFLEEILPSKKEREERRELIRTLTMYVMELWPQAKVVPYGSFGSGLSLKDSDIDLTIFKNGLFKDADDVWNVKVDQDYAAAVAEGRGTTEFLLPISDLMCKKMVNVRLIAATVPIVKCVDKKSMIDVDLSLNGIDGYLNTKFMSSIQAFDQRIGNLAALVKHWGRANNLNKTFEGSLSSYSYNLMVVNFCQIRGVALVLHHATRKTFKVKIKEDICGFYEHNHGDMANKAKDSDKLTLYDLLKSFFHYWHQEYNYCDDVVSVRMGKTISRKESECARDMGSKVQKIVIEDPFNIKKNVCASLQVDQLRKLREEFETSARLLEMGTKSWIDRYQPGASK